MEAPTGGSEGGAPLIEDRADPHRHLVVLYVITLIVSGITALAFH